MLFVFMRVEPTLVDVLIGVKIILLPVTRFPLLPLIDLEREEEEGFTGDRGMDTTGDDDRDAREADTLSLSCLSVLLRVSLGLVSIGRRSEGEISVALMFSSSPCLSRK